MKDIIGEVPLDSHGTKALPGSTRKLRVMQNRLKRKVCLHHPDDARLSLDFQKFPFKIKEGLSTSALHLNYHRYLTAIDNENYRTGSGQ